MSISTQGPLPFLDQLPRLVEYLYFHRLWWPEGEDVVVYWRDEGLQCHRFRSASRARGGQPLTSKGPINPQLYKRLHDHVVDHGVLDATSLSNALTTSHAFDT